jgi:hypothetical protein
MSKHFLTPLRSARRTEPHQNAMTDTDKSARSAETEIIPETPVEIGIGTENVVIAAVIAVSAAEQPRKMMR